MEADWDLHAVVRGCTAATSYTVTATTTVTITSSSVSSSGFVACIPPSTSSSSISIHNNPAEQGGQVLSLSENPFEARSSNSIEKSFMSFSSLSSSNHSLRVFKPLLHFLPFLILPHLNHLTNNKNKSSSLSLTKRRGYYRCSSSKGCLARKQVERNRSDPTMFSHIHSLATSTRHKPQNATAVDAATKAVSPSTSEVEEEVAQHSAKSESTEEEDMEDLMKDDEESPNEFGITDTMVTHDFFEGLKELTGSATDPFTAISSNIDRWPLPSNAATAAGGSC